MNKPYPQGDLDKWLLKQTYDVTRAAYPQLNIPERPGVRLNPSESFKVKGCRFGDRSIPRFWQTTLDLGVCGEQPIDVAYSLDDGQVELDRITWRGVDIKNHLSEMLLMDLANDIKEGLE